MLKKVNLEAKLKKSELKKLLDDKLGYELGKAQRAAREAGMPIIMVFEGWRNSRRGEIVGKMMQYMDARGFRVFTSTRIPETERQQPFFTSFWKRLPPPGHIFVYRHSWYYLKNDIEVKSETKSTRTNFDEINAFEKQLTDGHYCLLKFFVHISEKQQEKNRKNAMKASGKAWKPVKEIYSEEGQYDKFYKRYDEMLKATDTENAPWNLISGEDVDVAEYEIFNAVVDGINKAVKAYTTYKQAQRLSTNVSDSKRKYDILSKVDLSKDVSKDEYKVKLEEYQKRLRELQVEAFNKGVSTILAFEGWDAGGKGGAIKRVAEALDPLDFSVHPYSAPNQVERLFHYLWRFWINVPAPGQIALFDRTWYGRVMVERIEKITPDVDWRRGYDEINEMEKEWTEANIVVLKFWLQIDKDEQARRFKERESNPEKLWKITDEDWRNRAKWAEYEDAVNEMIGRTNTDYAPWIIVEGNSKLYARLKVLKTIIDALEKKLKAK